jgi:glycosyltransferase involved in cell wall biosynthesis
MKIGVDAREIQHGVITGIGRSLSNFIHYFAQNETQHELVLFSETEIPVERNNNISSIVLNKIFSPLWDQWRLPKAIKDHEIDLFYSPYYKIPLLTKIPIVNQILDLMFLSFESYRKQMPLHRKLYYPTFGKWFAHKSINIITDSHHAKKDIVRIWNINPEKIAVIPLGLANRYKPVTDAQVLNRAKRNYQLPDRFVLYLGNFLPHKNVKSLVEAFKTISPKFPDCHLVLAGPLDNNGLHIKRLVSSEGLEHRVTFTNTIREKDHPEALLSLAEVFVFPTFYEGFGLPPLEAMACGTPVVVSNRTSVPEVVGDAGLLINPDSIEELSDAISGLLGNPEKRSQYSKKGLKRAEHFNEKATAGRLFEHIISLVEKIE